MNAVCHLASATALSRWLVAGLGAIIFGIPEARAWHRADNRHQWPIEEPGTQISFYDSLGPSNGPLIDGSKNWTEAIFWQSIEPWNTALITATGNYSDTGAPKLGIWKWLVDQPPPPASGDYKNHIFFSATIFGRPFDPEGIAWTAVKQVGTKAVEADVIFNSARVWNSYRGRLQRDAAGAPIYDIQRIAMHEFGHVLGLGHENAKESIMRDPVGDIDRLQPDDVEGILAIYGNRFQANPSNNTVPENGTANFSVSVSASGSFAYQWLFNGSPLALGRPSEQSDQSSGAGAQGVVGAGTPNLKITNVSASNVGSYSCRITDLEGGFTYDSASARLVLGQLPPRLVNISTRARVGSGDEALIAGFVVSGTGTKRTIVRALGPSLVNANVSGVLANPVLEVHNSSGALLASNDDWRSNQAVVEATGLAPTRDLESALVLDLPAGAYTAIVRGANGATGVAIVEVYDLQPNASDVRPVNLSARGRVQTGDNVMIAGFVINGVANRRVVVRALGPSLARAGVQGVLANPTLQIYNGRGQPIALNDDWQTQTVSGSLAADLSALNLAPSDPREAALVLSLPPGSYTAIVRGVGDSSGVSLVEAYEEP